MGLLLLYEDDLIPPNVNKAHWKYLEQEKWVLMRRDLDELCSKYCLRGLYLLFSQHHSSKVLQVQELLVFFISYSFHYIPSTDSNHWLSPIGLSHVCITD